MGAFVGRLAQQVGVVVWDGRGTGLSDAVTAAPTLEERVDDLRCVLDSAGVDSVMLLGTFAGDPVAIAFTARYPERVRSISLYQTAARFIQDPPDFPWGLTVKQVDAMAEEIDAQWGDGALAELIFGPTAAVPGFREQWGRMQTSLASPSMARLLLREYLDRVLATVLFTDIVGSTEQLGAAGDTHWSRQLDVHDEIVDRLRSKYSGRQVNHTGDGVFALFDVPSKAARCALELVPTLAGRGIRIRAGIHVGECERRGDEWSGLAVHTGARVCAMAGAAEILCTRTLHDLAAGSGLTFESLGPQQLKVLPEEVDVYRVTAP